MSQPKRGRPEGTGRLQRAILAYLSENHLIPQSAISARVFMDFAQNEQVAIKPPSTNRALRILEKQGKILRFKSWHPHPFTDKKKLLSYVVAPDCEIFGVPAREAVRMLEIRNGGSLIPWSVEWLRGWYYERTGTVLSAKGIRKILAYANDNMLDALDTDDETEVWAAIAGQAISAGGILKFGEKQLVGWGESAEAPDNGDIKRYALSHNDKSEPASSSPRPVAEVLPADDENGFTKLDRRVEVAQRRLDKIKETG